MPKNAGSVRKREIAEDFHSFTFLKVLTVPACILDGTGEIRHLNAAWREYACGSDIRGERFSWSDLIVPDDFPALRLHLQSALMRGEQIDIECRLRGVGETIRWFQISMMPVDQQLEGQLHWLCIASDIHKLKRREIDLLKLNVMQSSMLDISVDCIKLIALDGTLLHMNRAGCDALGVAKTSDFGMPWMELLPEDIRIAGERALALAKSGKFSRFPGRSVSQDHTARYWDNMLTPVVDAKGEITAILCLSREVTAEREAEATLEESRERLAIAARVGGLGIWDYDIRNDELHCDEAWYRIMGRDPAFPIRSLSEFRTFIHPDDVDQATEVTRTAAELVAAERDYAIVFRIIRPNGDVRWVRSSACLQHTWRTARRAVGFVVDITDTKQAELAMRDANRALEEERMTFARQSLEDPLTGIANRRHLDTELADICSRVNKAGEVICIGMIDVDHFKAYNDRYGHLEGDIVLRKVASALRSALRKTDFVARYGGEEFAFILVNMDNPKPLLDRLIMAVTEMAIPHEGSPTGYLSVSCGCVVFDSEKDLSPQQLLKMSDEVLYEAKATGRNRHVIRRAADNSIR